MGEPTNEGVVRQGANTTTKEGEPEVVSGLKGGITTNEVAKRQEAAARQERVETTKGQDIEAPSRTQTNTEDKRLDKNVDKKQREDNVGRDPIVPNSSNNAENIEERQEEVEVEEKLEVWAEKLREVLNCRQS